MSLPGWVTYNAAFAEHILFTVKVNESGCLIARLICMAAASSPLTRRECTANNLALHYFSDSEQLQVL